MPTVQSVVETLMMQKEVDNQKRCNRLDLVTDTPKTPKDHVVQIAHEYLDMRKLYIKI